jgi:Neuraminidase (sialidase)
MNVMSVSLLRLQNGSIALFYARKNSLDDCIPQIRISNNEGKDWSEPVSCINDREGYFVLNNDRVLLLESGRLLMPVSLHKTSTTEWSHKGQLRCYYSDDQGETWNSGEMVPSPDSIITQEPGVVELKDGKVLMIIRASGGRQYQSISKDQGLTWTYAKPTDIESPISPASLERIPSTHDLLLVWNNNGKSGPGYYKAKRNPLTLAVSKNDGKTWKHQKDIENNSDGMYCYTAIHFIGDYMLLAYLSKLETEGGYGITMRRLGLKDIYGK